MERWRCRRYKENQIDMFGDNLWRNCQRRRCFYLSNGKLSVWIKLLHQSKRVSKNEGLINSCDSDWSIYQVDALEIPMKIRVSFFSVSSILNIVFIVLIDPICFNIDVSDINNFIYVVTVLLSKLTLLKNSKSTNLRPGNLAHSFLWSSLVRVTLSWYNHRGYAGCTKLFNVLI